MELIFTYVILIDLLLHPPFSDGCNSFGIVILSVCLALRAEPKAYAVFIRKIPLRTYGKAAHHGTFP